MYMRLPSRDASAPMPSAVGSVPTAISAALSCPDCWVEPSSMNGMLWACITPPHPIASAATSVASQTVVKTVREDRRKAALADAALSLIDPIDRTMKCDGPGRKVQDRVGGAGIAVARLAHAPRIQERAGREGIRRVVRDPARLLVISGPEKRRHVGVTGAAVRGLRERERCGRALRVRHVF